MKRVRMLALSLAAALALSGVFSAAAGSPVYLNHGSCSATGTTHQYQSSTQGVTFGGSSGCWAELDFFYWDPVLGGWRLYGIVAGYTYLSLSIGISTTGKSFHWIGDDDEGCCGDSGWSYSWT